MYPDYWFDLVSGRIMIFTENNDVIDIADDDTLTYAGMIGRKYLEFIFENKCLICYDNNEDYQKIVRWLVRAFYLN